MVRMTAKAIADITCEPSREHAIELVLLGHLLAAQLKRWTIPQASAADYQWTTTAAGKL